MKRIAFRNSASWFSLALRTQAIACLVIYEIISASLVMTRHSPRDHGSRDIRDDPVSLCANGKGVPMKRIAFRDSASWLKG